ncbi:MAG: LacI family DNA-binding transcriptional regulator [Cephaloticoccus sp.]|nr:LacI family DNA-binding transcriptional regulator [Cephaloticoccus sp.]
MPTPTLRSLALELGLSRTTLSDALRGSPRVKAETVARVLAAAKAAGYERNPLTGAVMSQLRRSRGQQFRGVLAAVEIVTADHTPLAARYNDSLMSGISDRAEALGFKVERFMIGKQDLTLPRLDTILHTRGIQGLILLPAVGFPDFTALNWERYTAVYADYYIDHPRLHCVCSDHYQSMVALLQELHARGYRRPGLFMEIALDERLQYRWEGAFLALQKYLPGITQVPALQFSTLERTEFEAWFRKYNPDVVMGHFPAVMEWMKGCGARIPQTHAFVCLNSLRTTRVDECASMDFQTPILGSRACELVIGQLLHNEFGVPTKPSLTTIPALFTDGPTLRARAPAEPRNKPAVTSGAKTR